MVKLPIRLSGVIHSPRVCDQIGECVEVWSFATVFASPIDLADQPMLTEFVDCTIDWRYAERAFLRDSLAAWEAGVRVHVRVPTEAAVHRDGFGRQREREDLVCDHEEISVGLFHWDHLLSIVREICALTIIHFWSILTPCSKLKTRGFFLQENLSFYLTAFFRESYRVILREFTEYLQKNVCPIT